ncbi:DUF86 domain-containing protein [Rhodococcus sp. BS-15]|uniref:HepT-like ribonuclease domain-containing protein n=1 Tax=Rhodococcus sp. BS-15 TaxID=1304954 RepID=UPI000A4907F5|nr:HepT-like ribonuclease domain-containing protein [Rhodococcus sp. BS-15]
MSKNPAPYLTIAAESLSKILADRPDSEEALTANGLLWDATLMRVQVAGENLVKIRDQFPDFYAEHHDENWHKLIAMRNIISHAYSDVDPAILWRVIVDHLEDVRARMLELASVISGG